MSATVLHGYYSTKLELSQVIHAKLGVYLTSRLFDNKKGPQKERKYLVNNFQNRGTSKNKTLAAREKM